MENERTVTGMAKYIDREALIEWLKRIPIIDLSDGRGLCRVIMEDDFKKAIKKMPKGIIADVEPVQEWIPVTDETKPKCPCLVIDVHGNLPRVAYQILHYTSERFGYFCCDRDFEQMATDIYTKKKVGVDNAVMVAHGNRIAYWMPLPPLPKGE